MENQSKRFTGTKSGPCFSLLGRRSSSKGCKKTAANVSGIDSTYNQCYRAIDDAKENRYMNSIHSYELIIPYLNKIKENDNNAHVDYQRDEDNCITHLFICPGCSNDNLIHVRPVISLDAAH